MLRVTDQFVIEPNRLVGLLVWLLASLDILGCVPDTKSRIAHLHPRFVPLFHSLTPSFPALSSLRA